MQTTTPTPLIQLHHVNFCYPTGEQVFHDFNFTFDNQMRAGIIGHNGCGKTTLLHLIMGLHKSQAGQVSILGKNRLTEKDFYEVRANIGFIFQDANDQLFCPTVADDIAFGPLNQGVSRQKAKEIVKETLDKVGLNGFEERVTHLLSDGQKKLVAIATALAMQPKMLILDEPTTCLDEFAVARIEKILLASTIPYLIVSHDHDFLKRVITHTFKLHEGKITQLLSQ